MDSSRQLPGILLRLGAWSLYYLVPLSVALLPSVDEDIWWHLRSGQWIIEHRTLPVTDPFSRYGLETGKPYIAYSWLFEVLAAGVYQNLGLMGFAVGRVILTLAILIVLHRLLARRQLSFASAAGVAGLAAFALLPLITERPWLFTILFSTWTLGVILDLRNGMSGKAVWLLPVLYVIWANLHIQFIYGLLLLGLACGAPVLDRLLGRDVEESGVGRAGSSNWWRLVLLTVACTAATLVNPFHIGLYQVVFEYAGQKANLVYVTEMHALEFRKLCDWCVLALAGVAAFSLGRRPRLGSLELLLLIAAAWFAFRSRRDVWFLVLAAAGIIGCTASRTRGSGSFLPNGKEGAVVAGIVSFVLSILAWNRLAEGTVRAAVETSYPAQAVEFIKRQGYRGPLYNPYNWGGYLMCALPEMPVALDGRANFHGDDRLEQAMTTREGKPGWQADPDLATAQVVIAEAETPLAALLRLDDRFQLVLESRVAVVFVARSVPHLAVGVCR